MSSFDDLERQLRGVVRERAAQAPARRRRWRPGRALALAAALVVPAGGVAMAAGMLGGPDNVSVAKRDGTPNQQGTQVLATTQRPDGEGQLGVVVYRNQANALCYAFGVLRDGKVGAQHAGSFRELPLKLGASCGFSLDPVAFSLRGVMDNPKTQADDAHSVFAGVAAANVEAIEIEPRGRPPRTVTPSSQGAFITAFDEPITAATTLRVRLTDDSEKVISLPPSPGAQKFLQSARRNAPKPGQHP